jgi:hypothetical protein
MYYVPNQNDNRRSLIFILIMLIIFILGCVFSFPAQIKRTKEYNYDLKKYVTVLSPAKPLRFGDGKDTSSSDVVITIKSDSIAKGSGSGIFSVYLNVKYPKTLDLKYEYDPLKMEFDNGYVIDFGPMGWRRGDNSVDYRVSEEALVYLTKKQPVQIQYQIARAYLGDRTFFSDFLSHLKLH